MLGRLLMLMRLTGVPRLAIRLMLDRRVPLGLKLIIPAALVYLILPRDIIPDMLPALGRIDDILVLLFSLALFLGMAPKDVVRDNIRNPRGRNSKSGPPVIEGTGRIVDDSEEPDR